MKKISFIIPVYNEEDALLYFLEKLFLPEIEKIKNYETEIILVDDGSCDNSLSIMSEFAKTKKLIKIIALSRNFGKESALAAGVLHADGDAIIILDADGQHPPRLIQNFIEKWENGADTVIGIRNKYNKHGMLQKIGSNFFYKIIHLMGNTYIISGSTDFRLLDRVVVDEYNKLTEHNRITRGLIDWLGFSRDFVYYESEKRYAGRPGYDMKKLIRLAIDSFISLSTTPLVIFGYAGGIITFFSMILGVFVIINQHIMGDPLGLKWNGAIQLSIFITFLVGLILISQAITALYISQIHAETKNRPLFIINKKKSKNIK